VWIASGSYTGNYTVGAGVIVRSESGLPADVILDGNAAGRVATLGAGSWLIGCTVTNGNLSVAGNGSGGGGVYGGSVSNCVIVNCVVAYIVEGLNGGGGVGSCTVWNSIIKGNTANWGGGGAEDSTCYNSLIAGNNSGPNSGGAGYVCTFYNCTITGNNGDTGSGYNCSYYNSIAWGNSLLGDSSFGDHYSCGSFFTNASSITTDPLFISSSDFILKTNSPCIDAGDNDGWVGLSGSTDLNGSNRIYNVTVDMGAYEYSGDYASPLKPIYPIPTNDAVNQLTNTVVSWQDGGSATGYKINFGLAGSMAFISNTVATNYNPGALTYSSNYQWRIDATSVWGVATGDVWGFTVMDEPPPAIPRIRSSSINHINAANIFRVKGRVE
jgi:hypothetical protein